MKFIVTVVFIFSFLLISAQGKIAHSFDELNKDPASFYTLRLKSLPKVLPIEVSKLQAVIKLDLNESNLQDLPAWVLSLKSLKKIDISGNQRLNVNQVFGLISQTQLEDVVAVGCNLAVFPFQLAKLKTLKLLNLSNNAITQVSPFITQCTKLQVLDLSKNQLDSIKAPLYALKRLEVLDISFNKHAVISHLIDDANDFPALETLGVNGVNDFPNTLGFRKKPLQKLSLGGTQVKSIEQLGGKPLLVNEVEMVNCDRLNYDFACKTLGKSGVKKLVIGHDKLERLPRGILQMKELEYLCLSQNNMNYLPSLNQLKKLKYFKLGGGDVKTIFRSVNLLDSLEIIDISLSNIPQEEAEQLAQHFPNTQVIYNPKVHGTPLTFPHGLFDFNLKSPFPSLAKRTEAFRFRADVSQVFKLKSGTNLHIESDAFVDDSGNKYVGEVNFEVVELKSGLDIYLSGFPMQYDSAGSSYAFESGGMYELKAFSENGDELTLGKGKRIEINTSLDDSLGGFSMYSLNNKSEWERQDDVYALPTIDYSYVNMRNALFSALPEIKTDDFAIKFIKEKDVKGYKLAFRSSFDGQGTFSNNSRNNSNVSFYHFRNLQGQRWIITEKDFGDKLKLILQNDLVEKHSTLLFGDEVTIGFDKLYKVGIKPSETEDCFVLRIETMQDIFEIKIAPDMDKVGPKSSKRRIASFWKRFKRSEAKVEKRNALFYNQYERELEDYQTAMQAKANALRNSNENSKIRTAQNPFIASVNTLGICNIDRIRQDLLANGINVNMNALDSLGNAIDFKHFSVISARFGQSLSYSSTKFRISKNDDFVIIGETDKGELALLNLSKMRQCKFKNGTSTDLAFELFDADKLSRAELVEYALN